MHEGGKDRSRTEERRLEKRSTYFRAELDQTSLVLPAPTVVESSRAHSFKTLQNPHKTSTPTGLPCRGAGSINDDRKGEIIDLSEKRKEG